MLMNIIKKEIKKYKNKIIVVFILLMAVAISNVIQPLLTRTLIDEGLYGGNVDIVIKYSILILGLYMICFIGGLVKEFLRIELKNSFNKKLWKEAINKIYRVKIGVIHSKNSVAFIQSIENDISMMCSIFDDSTMFALTEILSIIGGTIGLFVVSYKMALLVLFFVPVKLLEVYLLSNKNMEIMKNYIKGIQEVSKWLGEYVNGIKDIRLWGMLEKVYEIFKVKKNNEMKLSAQKSLLTYANMNIDNLFIEVVVTAIYIVGVILSKNEMITVGGIIVFITYSTYVLAPLSTVFNIFFILSGIKPSYERLNTFFNEEEENIGENKVTNEICSIDFNNVSFSYQNLEVFSNITFGIRKNQKIIIFGKNGCGKTTLINLLLRLENKDGGTIWINEKDITSFNIEEYRKKIAIALTDCYLFNDTIINNICVNSSTDNRDLEKVMEICLLDRLIDEKGKDYLIGDNGEFLSAGQRQKICIARALISDRKFVILDEPTTNLDIESKNRIISYIFNIDKTVLIISHDKDILLNADKIVYFKDGVVNDEGEFDDLMNRNISFKQEVYEV